MTLERKLNLALWMLEGKRGLSTMSMASVALGINPNHTEAPYDRFDFGRCCKMLGEHPWVLEEHAEGIANLSDRWSAFVMNWGMLAEARRLGAEERLGTMIRDIPR